MTVATSFKFASPYNHMLIIVWLHAYCSNVFVSRTHQICFLFSSDHNFSYNTYLRWHLIPIGYYINKEGTIV